MVVNNKFIHNIPIVNNGNRIQGTQRTTEAQSGFGDILQKKLEEGSALKFSKHAELRLQSRNINLSQAQKDKIGQAVSRAEGKGVKDSLVLMDDVAFVVNVKSRTVITAVNSNELKDNVFTNIDGAVFA